MDQNAKGLVDKLREVEADWYVRAMFTPGPERLIPGIEAAKAVYDYRIQNVAGSFAERFAEQNAETYQRELRALFDGPYSDERSYRILSALGWCMHETHMKLSRHLTRELGRSLKTHAERGNAGNVWLLEQLETLKNVYPEGATRDFVLRKILNDRGSGAALGATDLGLRALGAAAVEDRKLVKKLSKAARAEARSRGGSL